MQTKDEMTTWDQQLNRFYEHCRQAGLKMTPQRLAVYKALVEKDLHPTAEDVFQTVRRDLPNISLDTVNRTLLTLAEIGAAFVVEGTGQPRRYDGGMTDHQHFRCLRCGKIIDFHYAPYDGIETPPMLDAMHIIRKTVYLEGYCPECNNDN